MPAADPTLTALTATNGSVQLLTFKLDDQEYALNIADVVQVVRMVAVTRALKAPTFVEGMINLRGRVIPVVSLRQRCGLPDRPYDLNTQLLIARAGGRLMALMVAGAGAPFFAVVAFGSALAASGRSSGATPWASAICTSATRGK